MKNNRIIVIGGGPAGMMAAIRAGQLVQRVELHEKNNILGKKLLLTGKGRCNLTNNVELEEFFKRFSGNGYFLRDAFSKFFSRELMEFFEQRGLRLKIERQGRIFPVTDDSQSVLKVLHRELEQLRVRIIYNSSIKDLLLGDKRVQGVSFVDKESINCQKVIFATGGVSYGFTGSTGDGLRLAERIGHRIVKLKPGLVALETIEKYPSLLEGLTLRNIGFIVKAGNKKIKSEIGELLFTDFGISGPLILSMSGRIIDLLDKYKKVCIEIDLKPALTEEQLDKRLLREFQANPRKIINNILKNMLPQRLTDVFLGLSGIPAGKNVSQITNKERRGLVELFKGWKLYIKRSRPIKDAMITRGGVSLKDINPRTMESRSIKGLYFAGEIIDVDGDTGGFNLQAAFSTGYLAGESASLK